ncbi:MAG: sigma-70 family RNA polymerase sigma factor [Lachnospiraceae bacterium]|nr:sigma-70 family RNA polymerase sigma factor [Lachnospiraceae bacterium]
MSITNQEELYREYHDKVMGYVFNRIGNKEEAEDITAEIFLKACRAFDGYDPNKASVSTWIYTIMRNTLTDYFRKNPLSEELSEDIASTDNIEDYCVDREELGRLAEALKALDKEQQDIIVLRYYDEYSLVEIARILNISYGMIKVKHKNALNALRNLM